MSKTKLSDEADTRGGATVAGDCCRQVRGECPFLFTVFRIVCCCGVVVKLIGYMFCHFAFVLKEHLYTFCNPCQANTTHTHTHAHTHTHTRTHTRTHTHTHAHTHTHTRTHTRTRTHTHARTHTHTHTHTHTMCTQVHCIMMKCSW